MWHMTFFYGYLIVPCCYSIIARNYNFAKVLSYKYWVHIMINLYFFFFTELFLLFYLKRKSSVLTMILGTNEEK
jgi:hypothetical protein